MRNKQRGKEHMFIAIKEKNIVTFEKKERDLLLRYQEKRLKDLREMLQKQNAGKRLQDAETAKIVVSLQNAGILDAQGELAFPYKNEE